MKGFMQTWGVHTRQPLSLGPRGLPPESRAAPLDAGPPVRLTSPHGLETVPTP
jgi:hypothetical protein